MREIFVKKEPFFGDWIPGFPSILQKNERRTAALFQSDCPLFLMCKEAGNSAASLFKPFRTRLKFSTRRLASGLPEEVGGMAVFAWGLLQLGYFGIRTFQAIFLIRSGRNF